MHGHQQVSLDRVLRLGAGQDAPAILADGRGAAEDSARSGCAKRHDECRADQGELALEPLMTRAISSSLGFL